MKTAANFPLTGSQRVKLSLPEGGDLMEEGGQRKKRAAFRELSVFSPIDRRFRIDWLLRSVVDGDPVSAAFDAADVIDKGVGLYVRAGRGALGVLLQLLFEEDCTFIFPLGSKWSSNRQLGTYPQTGRKVDKGKSCRQYTQSLACWQSR